MSNPTGISHPRSGRGWLWRIGGACSILLLAAGGALASPGVDHGAWDGLLKRFVRDGLVDYEGLRAELGTLDRYLEALKSADPSQEAPPSARLAFWINAYNATVIRDVLAHYPTPSVKKVGGFFDRTRHPVGGEALTLNEIEAKGRALGDWRIHFAVVCASSSCPPLRSEAYQGDRLEAQLADQTTRFLRDAQRGLRLEGNTLWLSKVFQWYAKDFVQEGRMTVETLLPVLQPYLSSALAEGISRQAPDLQWLEYDWGDHHLPDAVSVKTTLNIKWMDYDWGLNERRTPGT